MTFITLVTSPAADAAAHASVQGVGPPPFESHPIETLLGSAYSGPDTTARRDRICQSFASATSRSHVAGV